MPAGAIPVLSVAAEIDVCECVTNINRSTARENRTMLGRRTMILSALSLGMTAPLHAQGAAHAGRLGEDGLYQLDWFTESFLDIAEDIAAAAAKGRRFAILWGLKGCPACKRMHEVHFQDAALVGFIRARFEILHLNILGAREVIDLDGRKFGEKAFAAHYGVRATPTFQFFPASVEGLAARDPQAREVARLPGLPEPEEFRAMFDYVHREGYRQMPFAEWRKTRGA